MNIAQAISRSATLQPMIKDQTEALYRIAVRTRQLYEEATAIRAEFGEQEAFQVVDELVYPPALLEAASVRYQAVVALIEAFNATQAAVDAALGQSDADV